MSLFASGRKAHTEFYLTTPSRVKLILAWNIFNNGANLPHPQPMTGVPPGWLGGVPREQKTLKGHLPRVLYHQAYEYTVFQNIPLRSAMWSGRVCQLYKLVNLKIFAVLQALLRAGPCTPCRAGTELFKTSF